MNSSTATLKVIATRDEDNRTILSAPTRRGYRKTGAVRHIISVHYNGGGSDETCRPDPRIFRYVCGVPSLSINEEARNGRQLQELLRRLYENPHLTSLRPKTDIRQCTCKLVLLLDAVVLPANSFWHVAPGVTYCVFSLTRCKSCTRQSTRMTQWTLLCPTLLAAVR